MREVEIDSIEAVLADIDGRSAANRFQQHELERWRATLIENPNALTDYVARYPRTDVRRLRALIKDARAAPGPAQIRAFRELFRFLRDNETAHLE
jgi:ribosome-associated protein